MNRFYHLNLSIKRTFLIVWLLFFIAIASSCATTPSGSQSFNIFSVKDDVVLGKKLSYEIEKGYKVSHDNFYNDYLNSIGYKLLQGVKKNPFNFTFKMVEDDGLNAFSLPGGPVYINRGILKTAENEAEAASVIAHEMGHVLARHATNQMSTRYGISILLSFILGNRPSFGAQIAADLFSTSGILAYSRSHEFEADLIAIKLLEVSGYPPAAIVSFFNKMAAKEKRESSAVAKFFSTHPGVNDRILKLKEALKKIHEPYEGFYGGERFFLVKKRLHEGFSSGVWEDEKIR